MTYGSGLTLTNVTPESTDNSHSGWRGYQSSYQTDDLNHNGQRWGGLLYVCVLTLTLVKVRLRKKLYSTVSTVAYQGKKYVRGRHFATFQVSSLMELTRSTSKRADTVVQLNCCEANRELNRRRFGDSRLRPLRIPPIPSTLPPFRLAPLPLHTEQKRIVGAGHVQESINQQRAK